MPPTFVNFLLATIFGVSTINSLVATKVADLGNAGDTAVNNTGCAALSGVLPAKVFYADSAVYQYENSAKQFWSSVEILAPLCIFRPECAQDVALAVKTLKNVSGSFAVRGGGHMGIAGSNNIDNGVLIVMSNLSSMHLSSDQSLLSLGSSHRWGDVYKYLANYDLAVPGGRLSPVGVPGLLLAGGINFYGNQYGWSADNVVQYEVVLASGDIVYASQSSNPDLFWALKGGSSNFGIVTRFDIQTIPSKKVWAGIYSVANEDIPAFLAATATYAANITDPLSHIVPATVEVGRDPVTAIGAAILFYDSDTISNPACFKPFFDIPSISNTMAFKTLAEFADETGVAVVEGISDIFAAGTFAASSHEDLLNGINISNTIFYERLPILYAQVPATNISIIEIDWQPIGKLWIEATNLSGGNPLNLSPKKVHIAYAGVLEWIGTTYSPICLSWMEDTIAAINSATQEAGIYSDFVYMGDAASFQTEGFFKGYGRENEERLRGISRRYDPERMFQTLMPGGFKIGV